MINIWGLKRKTEGWWVDDGMMKACGGKTMMDFYEVESLFSWRHWFNVYKLVYIFALNMKIEWFFELNSGLFIQLN